MTKEITAVDLLAVASTLSAESSAIDEAVMNAIKNNCLGYFPTSSSLPDYLSEAINGIDSVSLCLGGVCADENID